MRTALVGWTVVSVLLIASLARAQADDVEVQAKEATASSYLKAGMLPEAEAAIGEVIARAPTRASAYAVRAEIRLGLAGPSSELAALANPAPGRDYTTVLASLEGARADLQRYIELSPTAPDRDARVQQLGDVLARIGAAKKAQEASIAKAREDDLLRQAQDIEQEEKVAADEQAKRVAAEKARQVAFAKERKLARAEWETRRQEHEAYNDGLRANASVNWMFVWLGVGGVGLAVPLAALWYLGPQAGMFDGEAPVGFLAGAGASALIGVLFVGIGGFQVLMGDEPTDFSEPLPSDAAVQKRLDAKSRQKPARPASQG